MSNPDPWNPDDEASDMLDAESLDRDPAIMEQLYPFDDADITDELED